MSSPTFSTRLWALDFSVLPDAPDGTLFSLADGTGRAIRAGKTGSAVCISIDTRWNDAPPAQKSEYAFELSAPQGGSAFRLMWLDAVIRLYVDGRLIDEEWPLGLPVQGECMLNQEAGVEALAVHPLASVPEIESAPMEAQPQFYQPPYHNASVGDCMPFEHDGCYRLYHLFDRRHHASKASLGAHQWAHICTRDLKNWTLHPIAIGIDEQWEGSICTGSMIEYQGLIYAFYAVRMSDKSPARMTWATSKDGIHFEKSGQFFSLTDPYEPVSARDPKVFFGADGQYHMLVTTSLLSVPEKPGCLAHLTSPDLLHWAQHAPMYIPGGGDQPECSDYFEWNGFYYLVYATGLTAHYRISRHPFGPWETPANDILVTRRVAVPKTARFGDRLLVSGWIPLQGWGGCAVTYELKQREDGTLGVYDIAELEDGLPRLSLAASVQPGDGERVVAAPDGSFRMKGTLSLAPASTGEFVFRFGEAGYRLQFSAAEKRISFLRTDGKDIESVDGVCMDAPLTFDLTVFENAFLLMLPDGRLFLPPVLAHKGACTLSLACPEGSLSLSAGN